MLRGALAASLLLLPLVAGAPPATSDEGAPWWTTTLLDADRDGLDDALVPDLAGRAPLVVLAAFDGVPTTAERDAVRAAGFEIVAEYDHFDVLAVRALPIQVAALLDLPGVVFVEKNDVIVKLLKDSVPLLGAPKVWETYQATGQGITIAVIDDGAFEQHPDLSPKLIASYDSSRPTSAGPLGALGGATGGTAVTPAGEDGHGTHVAGTIIGPGTQSGGKFKGVAPGARFVNVKVFSGPNQTSSDIVLRGLDWVLSNADTHGTRIASMSIGGRASDGKDALSRAVNVAVDGGMIVVAAAGNAGPGPKTIATPGAAEKAITVGAVDKSKKIAPYSSRGPTLDGRVKPDIVAPGTQITSTVPPSTTLVAGAASGSSSGFYGALSGTSMAAPHVSGVIALMLEVNPDLTPIEVKQILIATAQDLGAKGKDNETGYGFVNAVAAAQVAKDPTLLSSPQFASIVATLPPPAEEDPWTRAQVQYETLVRSGMLPIYGAIALGVVLAFVIGIAIGRRARRSRA